MTRRGKIVLAVLVVGSALGLVAATNAWFIAVSNTPPGAINSALVRWLPAVGERSFTSLLTYGNIISGSGVDPDGVPLVLPGNYLLANVSTSGTTSTVRTSIARDFDDGPNHTAPETVDTVIHWEVRTLDGVELTQKRRDLMDAHDPIEKWWRDGIELGNDEKPVLLPNLYDIVTTTDESIKKDDAAKTTTTTTVVTTTYTPRPDAGSISSYKQEVTTIKVVIHESPVITPAGYEGQWDSAVAVLTAMETVLFVQASPTIEAPNSVKQPTRSYLIITPVRKLDGAVIPLALGNLSTTESNVRIGINGRLTGADGKITPLTLSSPDPADPKSDGSYYLGSTVDGKFIELIQFRPYGLEGQYQWVKVNEQATGKDSLWSLWDLSINGNTKIPPNFTVEPDPSTPDTPVAPTIPTPYTVTDMLRIVPKRPDVNTSVNDATFEQLFNQLYCDKVPTITLHLSYYVRQSEFMDWTEFHSQDIDLSMPK